MVGDWSTELYIVDSMMQILVETLPFKYVGCLSEVIVSHNGCGFEKKWHADSRKMWDPRLKQTASESDYSRLTLWFQRNTQTSYIPVKWRRSLRPVSGSCLFEAGDGVRPIQCLNKCCLTKFASLVIKPKIASNVPKAIKKISVQTALSKLDFISESTHLSECWPSSVLTAEDTERERRSGILTKWKQRSEEEVKTEKMWG